MSKSFIKVSVLLVLLGSSIIFALFYGAANISIFEVFLSFLNGDMSKEFLIIQEIRLPRITAAIVVGMGLAVSGAIMQGITKNPLASPSLFGLTAGANIALAVALAFIPDVNYITIILVCMMGATIAAAIVFSIALLKKGGLKTYRVVLAGAAVSAFFYALSSGIGLYFRVSKNILMYTSGGLIGTNWTQLAWITPIILIAIVISVILSKQLTILSLSDEISISLGQNTALMRILFFLLTTCMTGASVALVGNMTFVGLMVPHVVRVFFGTDYKRILPGCIAAGPIVILIADTLARTLYAPYEIPTTAIVAMMGFPLLLYVVKKGI